MSSPAKNSKPHRKNAARNYKENTKGAIEKIQTTASEHAAEGGKEKRPKIRRRWSRLTHVAPSA